MLKKYKNGFIEIIQSKGFEPQDFHAKEKGADGKHGFVISFRTSHLRFVVRNPEHSCDKFDYKHTSFGPVPCETEYLPPGGWADIEEVYAAFENWLEKAVRVYINDLLEPDLWMELERQKPLVAGSILDKDETSPFSEDEKTQLRLSINEFRLLVSKTFQPSQQELEVIGNRLDYLSNRLDGLNRVDWRGLALSTIISISIALSLDTEQGRVLLNLFKQVFSKILYLLQ